MLNHGFSESLRTFVGSLCALAMRMFVLCDFLETPWHIKSIDLH
jgi:hypothetical protein